MEHSRNVTTCKPLKRAFLCQSFPIQLGQPSPQPWMKFLTAICDEQEERHLPAAACQVQEQVQAEVITPVDVLHHEQHGVLRCLLRHKMGHGREESSLLLFRLDRWWCGQVCQVGEQK